MEPNIATNSATLQALLEQFTKSLQASVALTQSMQNLQSETTRQAVLIGGITSEMFVMRERINSLMNLVQGDGMSDSLYKLLIQMDLRLKRLENNETEQKEEKREAHRTHFPWKIAVWTIVAAFATMVLNVILSPLFNNFFTHKPPVP